MSFRFFTLLLVLLWATPVCTQPPATAETIAEVEQLYKDFDDGRPPIEQKFLLLPDGTRLRVKGVNTLTTGDKVKLKKTKVRKLEKAKAEPETTEAEIDAADLISAFISPTLPALRLTPLKVIVATWTVDPRVFQPPASIQAFYTSVDASYRANSYGSFGWGPVSIYWARIAPPSGGTCAYRSVETAARAVLATEGITVGGGYVQTVMQWYSACGGWSGLGIVGGQWTFLNGGTRSSIHELGHNLGLGHSGFVQCANMTCGGVQAYGDTFDPMGSSSSGTHFNTKQKSLLNWVAPQLVTAAGTYVLAPYETISSGAKALRLPAFVDLGSTTPEYFIESRSLSSGSVLVHRGTTLQDMDPVAAVEKRTLDPGVTYTLPDGSGRTITTVSRGTTGAVILVERPTTVPPPPALLVLSAVAVNQSSVVGGLSATGTVTVSAAAPSGGASVVVSSSSGAATVPPLVQVAAGQTTATFTASTVKVAAPVTVTIQGSHGGVSRTTALTVTPATTVPPPPPPPTQTLMTLTVNGGSSATVAAGQSYTLVATYNGQTCHTNKLDEVPITLSTFSCTAGYLSCTNNVTARTTSVSRTHTLKSSTCPTVSATVTVSGTPPPPPPPPPPVGAWTPATQLLTAQDASFSGAASGALVCGVLKDRVVCSDDEGVTWRAPVTLQGPVNLFLERPVHLDGQTVAVFTFRANTGITDWYGPRSGGVGPYWLWLSTDGGRTFPTVIPVSALTGKGYRGSVWVEGGIVHMTWMDYRNNRWDIYYRRYVVATQALGPELLLAQGSAPGTTYVGEERPSLACSGPTCWAVWMSARDNLPACQIEGGTMLTQCTEIYGARSLDSGVTWDPAQRLTTDVPYSGRPTITANDAATFQILYDRRVAGSTNDIASLRSTDSGVTWVPSFVTQDPGDQSHGSIGLSGSHAVAAWQGAGSTSLDAGVTWGGTEAVGNGSVPAIGMTTGYLHIFYGTGAGLQHQRKARSTP